MNYELREGLRNPANDLPCVFKTNTPPAIMPAFFPNSRTNITHELTRAFQLIGGTAAEQREGVARVAAALPTEATASQAPAAEWAGLAAATALKLGDLPLAEQLTHAAIKLDARNVQAGYLARIIERERLSWSRQGIR